MAVRERVGTARRALAAALLATACGAETGSGQVGGYLTVPGCLGSVSAVSSCAADDADAAPSPACAAFDLGVDFFTVDREGDQVLVRFQHGGDDFAHSDGLMLHLADATLPRGRLGVPLPVGPEESVRAALGLFERCAGSDQSFELRGTVTFEAFGTSKGDRVAGSLDELLVRDARTGALLGRLTGTFDFTVRRGPPYRRFSGP